MGYVSSSDKSFLNTLQHWLTEQPEILVLIRYPRAAGSKSFEFFSTFDAVSERIHQLPSQTSVIAFQPQLPLRGESR
jgi:hypothetical protein